MTKPLQLIEVKEAKDFSEPYWDQRFGRHMIRILPGDFGASASQVMFLTVLGSCVSVCLYDPLLKVGGMNHFMLPVCPSGNDTTEQNGARYGDIAMAWLVSRVIELGGERHNLRAKIFGGARVIRSRIDVGRGNIDFARHYCSDKGIEVVSEDVGGIRARKLYFIPETGEAYIKSARTSGHRVD